MPALSPSRAASLARDEKALNVRMFARLVAWGAAALVALVVAVAAERTELGSQRAHASLTAMLSPPAEPDQQLSEQRLAWSEGFDKQMRRQAEVIVALTQERDALTEKITALERQVGDLSGTLVRTTARLEAEMKTAQQAAAAASAAATRIAQTRPEPSEPAAPAVAPPGVAPPRTPPVREAAAPAAVPPAFLPNSLPLGAVHAGTPAYTGTIPMPVGATPETNGPPAMQRPFPVRAPAPAAPEVVAALARPSGAAPANSSALLYGPLFRSNPLLTTGILDTPIEHGALATEFAIDLGPATTIDAMRARWSEIKTAQSPLFDNLKPLVALKDGGKTGQELHLVAGPLTTTAASGRLCAVLSGTGVPCQATMYEGQRLTAR